jgi:DNA-directed RNA polymerase subunit RPC12/RpoP
LGNNEYRCSDCQKKLEDIIECSRCSKPIDDESYIEYKGESVHAECFTCYSCSEPLGNMLYVEHDNQPYCVPCHMDQFAQSCAICGRSFPPGTSTRKYGQQYFHIECFRCFQCGKIILTKNYIIDEDHNRLCDTCI